MRLRIWDARNLTELYSDVDHEITAFNKSASSYDSVDVSIPLTEGVKVYPWKHSITLEENGIQFFGVVTDIDSNIKDGVFTFDAMSWRGYPKDIIHGRRKVYTSVDPAQVVQDIWDEVLGYPDSPKNVVYQGITTNKRLESRGDDGKLNAYEIGWFKGSDCGNVITKMLQEFGLHQMETYSLDQQGKPVSTITLVDGLQKRFTPYRFASGENLVTDIAELQFGEDVYSSVLCLGAGQGSSRRAGNAARDFGIIRRTHLDTRSMPESTPEQLRKRAEYLLEQQDKQLPFESLTVMQDSTFAPAGEWHVGDVVTVVDSFGVEYSAWIRRIEYSTDMTASIAVEAV